MPPTRRRAAIRPRGKYHWLSTVPSSEIRHRHAAWGIHDFFYREIKEKNGAAGVEGPSKFWPGCLAGPVERIVDASGERGGLHARSHQDLFRQGSKGAV